MLAIAFMWCSLLGLLGSAVEVEDTELRGAEEAAKKFRMKGEGGITEMAAAEAGAHFARVTARLKPCPFYKASLNGVFQQAVKPYPFYRLPPMECFGKL